MSKTNKPSIGTVKERIHNAKRSQWIKFIVIGLLYLLFVIWDNNYWLLLGLPLIFDIYISKVIDWGVWKRSENKLLRTLGEWTDAIVFALIAVYFINIFIFQNYKIPTSSLEKTLLVGDYLFVSKLAYGPRVPNTPLAFPLTHNTLPFFNSKSYSDWPHWEYKRLPGFGKVKRDDIVVFNYPAGDTVALNYQQGDYHALVNQVGWAEVNKNPKRYGEVVYRPVDRRENYVKRCVGLPGEMLEIKDNVVFVDGKELPLPKNAQFNYYVETHGNRFSDKQFSDLGVSKDDRRLMTADYSRFLGVEPNEGGSYNPLYRIPLTQDKLKTLKDRNWARSIHIEPAALGGPIYPYGYDEEFGWDRDNYGPIWIPKKGESIPLNQKNLAIYKRCIVNYEYNTLRIDGDKVYINGNIADTYTFKYNYYWMMGDNRHNSADSRSWGFVPEDHVVGQPIMIWLSTDKDKSFFSGIRWDRIFRWVKNQ
jgi:Signal peptidase I